MGPDPMEIAAQGENDAGRERRVMAHLGLSAGDPNSTVPPAADEDDLRMSSLDLSTYDEERQDANLVRLFLLQRDVILRWRDEFRADGGSMDLRSLSVLTPFPITRVQLCNIVDGTDPQLTARMNGKIGVALAFNPSTDLFDVRLDDDRPSDDARQISIHNLAQEAPPMRLQAFQDLVAQGQLVCLKISRLGALRGGLRRSGGRQVLTISYSWQGKDDPDSTNDRLGAVAAHLEEHPDIDLVWWDYPCLPQKTARLTKTEMENRYFTDILRQHVNIIYLSTPVLSIVNSIYAQRFWPQFEFFLATRVVSRDGFQHSGVRSFVRGIQSLRGVSSDGDPGNLRAKWQSLSTGEAVDILNQSDVTVTNQSDKVTLLGKLPRLETELAGLDLPFPRWITSVLEKQRARDKRDRAREKKERAMAEEIDLKERDIKPAFAKGVFGSIHRAR